MRKEPTQDAIWKRITEVSFNKLPPVFPTYIFKLVWRATAKTIKVAAKDYTRALQKAEAEARKMEGWGGILEIKFIERRG